MLLVDWSLANQMVGATMLALIILPIVILAWVFMKHPDEKSEK